MQCSAEYDGGAIGAESIVGRLSQALLKQCWRSNDEDDDAGDGDGGDDDAGVIHIFDDDGDHHHQINDGRIFMQSQTMLI